MYWLAREDIRASPRKLPEKKAWKSIPLGRLFFSDGQGIGEFFIHETLRTDDKGDGAFSDIRFQSRSPIEGSFNRAIAVIR